MGRLIRGDEAVRQWGERGWWQLRAWGRFVVRAWGWRTLSLIVLAMGLLGVTLMQKQRLASASQALAASADFKTPRFDRKARGSLALSGLDGRRERLQRFEAHLLSPDQIPQTLQDLMRLAQEGGLTVQRGEYRPQWDAQGRFTRYQMSWPVKGATAAVGRFVQAALMAQPALALERIQFKRERADAGEIEARLQWSLLVREGVGGGVVGVGLTPTQLVSASGGAR
jgi:hypothetical protein